MNIEQIRDKLNAIIEAEYEIPEEKAHWEEGSFDHSYDVGETDGIMIGRQLGKKELAAELLNMLGL